MTWEEMVVPLFFGTLRHDLVSLPDKQSTKRAPITQIVAEKASPEATVYREVKLLTQGHMAGPGSQVPVSASAFRGD